MDEGFMRTRCTCCHGTGWVQVPSKRTLSEIRARLINYINLDVEKPDIVASYIFDKESEEEMDTCFTIIEEVIRLKGFYFPCTSQLFLYINEDPERYDPFLVFSIRQDTYEDDFMDKIELMRSKCLDDLRDWQWYLITTDFKPLTKENMVYDK
jgi:hypothetical protein